MIIRVIVIVLLCCQSMFASQGMGPGPGIANGVAANQAGWIYSQASEADTGLYISPTYSKGSRVTIGAVTNITSVAFLVDSVVGSTTCKVALYDDASPNSNLLTAGTCTPANSSWCVAPITYTGVSGATYKVTMACNDFYSVAKGTAETYTGLIAEDPYGSFPSSTKSYLTYGFSPVTAICVGGGCGSPR